MGTKPAPHAGMGVAQYSWATSPLRRYVDLVNQWQIIACARHGKHRRAGRALQAEGRGAVRGHLRRSTPPMPRTTPSSRRSSATGRCAGSSRTASPSSTATVMQGRPGARRHAAAGVPRARAPKACRAARDVRAQDRGDRPADAGRARHRGGPPRRRRRRCGAERRGKLRRRRRRGRGYGGSAHTRDRRSSRPTRVPRQASGDEPAGSSGDERAAPVT